MIIIGDSMFIIGIIIIFLVGASLHFVYEWNHHNKLVAIFAAVNESTWEHIKICMTPTILWSIYEISKYGFNNQFIFAKSMSLLTIILVIPLLFYSYTLFTKKSILIVDIICFLITVICSQLVFNYIINLSDYLSVFNYIGIGLIIIELLLYFYLTFNPLRNLIFKDPITKKYGLEGHPCHHHHKH